VPERRPLPRVVTPLDRIVWALVADSGAWERLPSNSHDLLCDQPAPFGVFFRWLERLLADLGPQPAEALLQRMQPVAADMPRSTQAPSEGPLRPEDPAEPPPPELIELARRVQALHALQPSAEHDTAEDLQQLVRPLALEALREELDMLLQAGELSEAAEARKLELVRLTRDLKLEISQQRPISG
jgi:DNA primase